MARTPRGWHREDIKAKVRKTGTSLRALSLKVGLCESATRYALRHPLYKAEQAIANCIGVPAHEIWPDRYDASGNPLHPRQRREPSSAHLPRHGQKKAAA